MPLRLVRPWIACLLISVSQPCFADLGLGWDGSVVEAAYFAYQWEQDHPGEWTQIVNGDPAVDPKRVRQALAVYSDRGSVYLYDGTQHGRKLDLAAASMPDAEALRQAVLPQVADVAAAWPGATGTADERLGKALATIRADAAHAEFPIDRTLMAASRKKADGTKEAVQLETLVFDWAGRHYVYRPGAACLFVAWPKDERRGFYHAAVKYGDVVEAVLFASELRRQNPDTKVRVGFPRRRSGAHSVGSAAAFFVEGGKMNVYQIFLGELPFAQFKPEDFDRDLELSHAVWLHLSNALYKGLDPTGDLTEVSIAQVFETLPATVPDGLPADTPELQVRRAGMLLRRAGIPVKLDPSASSVRFTLASQEFEYEPALGARSLPITAGGNGPVFLRLIATTELFDALLQPDASKGRDTAGYNLQRGALLLEGSIPVEPMYARELLEPLLNQGNGLAALTLARFYQDNATNTDESDLALRANRVAAEAGFPEAMYNYGAMLCSGTSTQFNAREGLAWMMVAPSTSLREAGMRLALENIKNDPVIIAAAKARAEEIRAKLAAHTE